jgi:hypothetical protein
MHKACRTLVGLTRAFIFFAKRVRSKTMDCRIKSGNDDAVFAPADHRSGALGAKISSSSTRRALKPRSCT